MKELPREEVLARITTAEKYLAEAKKHIGYITTSPESNAEIVDPALPKLQAKLKESAAADREDYAATAKLCVNEAASLLMIPEDEGVDSDLLTTPDAVVAAPLGSHENLPSFPAP